MGKFRQILTEISARDTPNFRFRMITSVNFNVFSPNLVCALILQSLGLLMGKFRQILTELSARDTPIFSFPGDDLSKCQGILTRLGLH